jgi:O-antigen/teichoic acid export membrane protein
MLFVALSGLLGAAAAFFIILWPYGTVIACFGAVFGGSIFAGLAGLWLGRTSRKKKRPSAFGNETSESRTKVNSPPE